MSTIFNTPSLFLPYVRGTGRSPTVDLDFVVDVIENMLQSRGCISRIDHRPTRDGYGSMCFIHFKYWPQTSIATQMLIRLNSGEKNIKVYHCQQFYWKIALNTAVKKPENKFAPIIDFNGTIHKQTEAETAEAVENNERAQKLKATGQLLWPVTYYRLSELNTGKSTQELTQLAGHIVGMFVDPEMSNDLDEFTRMCRFYMCSTEKDCTKNEMDEVIKQGIDTIEESTQTKIF
jgi:hypothetical protein